LVDGVSLGQTRDVYDAVQYNI